jgi:hypothetical protein
MGLAKLAGNEQGLLQGWNSLLVLPGTAADLKYKSTS